MTDPRPEFCCAILLISKNPRHLADFYKNVLGIPLKDEQHDGSELHYGCEIGDLHFAIHSPTESHHQTPKPGSTKIAFEVFDLDVFLKRLDGHGVKPLYPPKSLGGTSRLTAILDPDGNEIEFTELSKGWFEHLEHRRKDGHDIIAKWKQTQSQPPSHRSRERATDKIIVKFIALPMETERAFTFFTDPSLVSSWLTQQAEIIPEIGGKYELFWNPNDRENDSTIGCKITAFVPNELLSFEWKGPKQFKSFMNSADPLTHVTVSFLPAGKPDSSVTKVHLVHSGWRNTPLWDEARQWFDRAWEEAFKQLEERTRHPERATA